MANSGSKEMLTDAFEGKFDMALIGPGKSQFNFSWSVCRIAADKFFVGFWAENRGLKKFFVNFSDFF
jgi:hypothetical protein